VAVVDPLVVDLTEKRGFRAFDAAGGDTLPGAGGGITAAQHEVLRQLIHFIDSGPGCGFASGAVFEATPVGPFPTSFVWYDDAAKTKKMVELTVTYTGAFPTTEVWKMYDADGSTVNCTVTDTIGYTGAFESSRSRVIV